jgi:hypothetical protein
MPKSKSRLSLSKRRERAFELFARGYTNKDVKADLGVSGDTVANYRKLFEERVHAQAASNPEFISDVLTNTLRLLTESDQVRADAWKHLEERTVKIECPKCEHGFKVKVPVTDQVRAQYHNVILKALDMRAKLFGILGVKAEMFAAVQSTQYVQAKMIEWMMKNLQPADRDSLASFMETELSEYVGGPILELPSAEVPVGSVVEP